MLTATTEELVLHVEAEDADALARGQALIKQRLEVVGRRDSMTLAWPSTGST